MWNCHIFPVILSSLHPTRPRKPSNFSLLVKKVNFCTTCWHNFRWACAKIIQFSSEFPFHYLAKLKGRKFSSFVRRKLRPRGFRNNNDEKERRKLSIFLSHFFLAPFFGCCTSRTMSKRWQLVKIVYVLALFLVFLHPFALPLSSPVLWNIVVCLTYKDLSLSLLSVALYEFIRRKIDKFRLSILISSLTPQYTLDIVEKSFFLEILLVCSASREVSGNWF